MGRSRNRSGSPTAFMPQVMAISPPVLPRTSSASSEVTRIMRKLSRAAGWCAAWSGPPAGRNANQEDSDPAARRNALVQKKHGQKRQYRVPERARGHHVAVVGPAQHRQIGRHEAAKKEYPYPDCAIRYGQPESMRDAAPVQRNSPDLRHAVL